MSTNCASTYLTPCCTSHACASLEEPKRGTLPSAAPARLSASFIFIVILVPLVRGLESSPWIDMQGGANRSKHDAAQSRCCKPECNMRKTLVPCNTFSPHETSKTGSRHVI